MKRAGFYWTAGLLLLLALPTAAESLVMDENCSWEEILAARDQVGTVSTFAAEDDRDTVAAVQELLARCEEAVKGRSSKADISDLNLDKTQVKALLNDLCSQVSEGYAIQKISLTPDSSTGIAASINFTYCSDEDIVIMKQRLDQLTAAADACCESDLEKAVYVHDWLVQNLAYDTEYVEDGLIDDHNARNALVDGPTVCEGYAKVYALALNRLDIPAVLVTSSTLNHAWNMVELDGQWYQVDCTWDDPTTANSDLLGRCLHENMLVTTDSLKSNHDHNAADFVAFDLHNRGLTNISPLADDDRYDNAWWQSLAAPLFPEDGDWYYAQDGAIWWRASLTEGSAAAVALSGGTDTVGSLVLSDGTLFFSNAQPGSTASTVAEYTLDCSQHSAALSQRTDLTSLGLARLWDGVYYAVSQERYRQTIAQFDVTPRPGSPVPPTATPTAMPTATPTTTPPTTPTATPTVAPTATPTAKPTATPTATSTATPTTTPTAMPTATPTATPTVAPTAKPTTKPTATPTAKPTATPKPTVKTTPMYRLYNPNSGEHFYTGSIEERDNLSGLGWNYEGVAWNAPTNAGTPVYRMFNPNSGDHHYTMSQQEVEDLKAIGWRYEGVCWNSGGNVPQFRLYNPNADCGSHHYTSSEDERDKLVALGWNWEGIGWFGSEQ